MITRRHLLGTASAGAALAVAGTKFTEFAFAESGASELTEGVPAGISSYVKMVTLPGKKPLIQLSDRGPNYESPLEYFRTPVTPNDEFFVRYHLSDIPEKIDTATYKIAVGGDGANGQFCIVLPKEDAVIAITAQTGNMQSEINVIWDTLLPALQSAPLPANPEEESKLKQTLATLEVPPPPAKAETKSTPTPGGATKTNP